MMTFQADDAAGIIEFTIEGRVERADYEAVVQAFETMIAARGKVGVVEIVHDYRGIDPSLWWRDVQWSFGHLNDFGRCAVVTDHGWIGPVTRFAAAFMPMEIRVFGVEQIDAARTWVREGQG